jgi:hypothetical protein
MAASPSFYSSFAFAHRAAAAIRATAARFSGVCVFSLILAPRFPRATAAGFFRFAINTILSAQ